MNAAIVLAAGRGTRMGSAIAKQFMELEGYPVLYYSLKAFEEYEGVDQVVLVVSAEEIEYCRREIVERYGFTKVRALVPGGAQRYDSVYEGLKALEDCETVMIHDGARPLITREVLERCLKDTLRFGSGVAGMPVKDTIKRVDSENTVIDTPDRSSLWLVQTPQAFSFADIYRAYQMLYELGLKHVTDDAMVLEETLHRPVHMTEGSYENIKITTPEDLVFAAAVLQGRAS